MGRDSPVLCLFFKAQVLCNLVSRLDLSSILEKTVNTGTKVSELYGDKAYFRKDILELLEEQKIKGYIPVGASVYKIDEELFS